MAKRAWMVLTLFIICVAMPAPVTVFAQDEEEIDEETKLLKEGLAALTAYKAEHGHVRVPKRFQTKDGFTLGSWVGSRRKEYKNRTLSQERIDALEEVGFIWDGTKK